MSATAIEWTERTWNPIVGCDIVSPGCTNCYAMRMAARIEAMNTGSHYAGTTRKVKGHAVWTGHIALAPEKTLLEPLRRKRPTTYFVNSMGDLFHESVPDDWIDLVFAVMALGTWHTFQVLTKRPERMAAYLAGDDARYRIAARARKLQADRGVAVYAIWSTEGDFDDPDPEFRPHWPLPNVWLGTSVEDQTRADERIPALLATPAVVRFISAEPLLGPINLTEIMHDGENALHALWGLKATADGRSHYGAKLDWVIVGGESGRGARPMHPDWARTLRYQCAAAGVAFFFKQWGAWGPIEHSGSADEAGWQGRGDWMILSAGGDLDIPDHRWPDEEAGEVAVVRVGKKAAGRLLDGVEHSAMPRREAS